jgi:hypothetical protein
VFTKASAGVAVDFGNTSGVSVEVELLQAVRVARRIAENAMANLFID